MSKHGTFISFAEGQEGGNPRIVTDSLPFPVVVKDDAGVPVVESYSGAIRTIETDHAMIHDGKGFQLSGEIISLANGADAYFLIDPTTPIHWRNYKFSADTAPINIRLFENPTTTANGTVLSPLNRNRLSATVSTSAIYSGPTVTADGTELYLTRIVGTGSGANRTGENVGLPLEWIIDGGNTYLLKVSNTSGGVANLTYEFFWYEL